jgi:hypothetical protein
VGESEDRSYLCGLADGLMLAKRLLSEEGQATDSLVPIIHQIGTARVEQLLDYITSLEPARNDLLKVEKL